MQESSKQRTAVVMGGAHDMGLLAAQILGAAGLRIVIADTDEDDRLNETLAILQEQGTQAVAYHMDEADAADIEGAAHLAMEQFGSVDLLVNTQIPLKHKDSHVVDIAPFTHRTYRKKAS